MRTFSTRHLPIYLYKNFTIFNEPFNKEKERETCYTIFLYYSDIFIYYVVHIRYTVAIIIKAHGESTKLEKGRIFITRFSERLIISEIVISLN